MGLMTLICTQVRNYLDRVKGVRKMSLKLLLLLHIVGQKFTHALALI